MTSFAQVPDFKTLSSQRLCCSLPMSMSKGRRKSFLMNDVSEVSRDWFNVWKLIEISGRGGRRLKGWRRRWKSPASSCAEVEIMAFQFSVNPIWKSRKLVGLYVQWQYGSKNQYSGMLHCTCPALWSLAIGKAPSGRRFLSSWGNRWNQMKTSIMSSRDLFDK